MALFLPEVLNGVSVLQFGADPTGSADSTSAFAAAVAATGRSDPIRVPTGTYLLDGNGVTYDSRAWIGQVSSAGQSSSILKARTAATSFAVVSSRTNFQDITFDANGICDYALRLNSAHNSVLFNVDCREANDFALFSDEMNVALVVRLTCRNSANGVKFLGPNGIIVQDMRLANNVGVGADFIGVRSGETSLSGQFSAFGFRCISNGGAGVQIRGVTNGMISGGTFEDNGGDALVLDDGAADILIDSLAIVGDGSGGEVAVNVIDAKVCTFRGITVLGADPTYERAVITEPSQVMQFYSAYTKAGEPLDLVYTDGVTEYTANPDGANLKAAGAPTAGQFRQGHIAWNGAPIASSNRGWRCTVAGAPGTWSSF